ncbi:hypothetical protein DFS34DRAFT_694425 [Phlyctochytrium arcticum]|nr:hypothetical protein DFS34DRAFT_694425 [Phlyctochytrium arcticum]
MFQRTKIAPRAPRTQPSSCTCIWLTASRILEYQTKVAQEQHEEDEYVAASSERETTEPASGGIMSTVGGMLGLGGKDKEREAEPQQKDPQVTKKQMAPEKIVTVANSENMWKDYEDRSDRAMDEEDAQWDFTKDQHGGDSGNLSPTGSGATAVHFSGHAQEHTTTSPSPGGAVTEITRMVPVSGGERSFQNPTPTATRARSPRMEEPLHLQQPELPSKFPIALATRARHDTVARWVKKRFAKSSENKIGALASYREDLLVLLEALIPLTNTSSSSGLHPPLIRPVPHTPLCAHCRSLLTYALHISPARVSPYIYEHSTVAFLSLIDFAEAYLSQPAQKGSKLPQVIPSLTGGITRGSIYATLRAELSVVEWRVSLKLARYHKRCQYLTLFPVRIGEFAQLTVESRERIRQVGEEGDDGIMGGVMKRAIRKVVGGAGPEVPKTPMGPTAGKSAENTARGGAMPEEFVPVVSSQVA